MAIFRDMRITRTGLLLVVGFTLAARPVVAVNRVVKPSDFSAIEKRNPFGLVDPPKPVVIPVPEKIVEAEPPPNVELTGMYHDSVREKTFALFLVQVKGEAKKRSYMLSVGEGQDGLKVESIDRKESNVKINLKGLTSTITFNKPKAAPVASPRPPQVSNPMAITGRRPTRSTTTARPGSFTGTSRSVSAVAGGMNTEDPVQSGSVNGGLRAIPTRQMRTQQPMTRQEQEILIEAQRAKIQFDRQQNPGSVPALPPMPPTSLTTEADLQRIVVPPPVPGGQ